MDLPEYMKGWTSASADGANTLGEATRMLRDFAGDLEGLAALGFELRDPIVDDYGYIGRPDDGGPIDPEDWPDSDLEDDHGLAAAG